MTDAEEIATSPPWRTSKSAVEEVNRLLRDPKPGPSVQEFPEYLCWVWVRNRMQENAEREVKTVLDRVPAPDANLTALKRDNSPQGASAVRAIT